MKISFAKAIFLNTLLLSAFGSKAESRDYVIKTNNDTLGGKNYLVDTKTLIDAQTKKCLKID
ncbi:MAG TPA: hypothetical protein VNX40_10230 [Mucilaginibacter sp.]|jgi:hypothetical protein|nr:hypothetical protein [Mucilaginibacter sp.]